MYIDMFNVVIVQFNTAAPRVMIDSLRHSGVNGKVALKLYTCSWNVMHI